MARVHCCDWCRMIILDSDIRITIDGFSVIQNMENNDMPKGFCVKNLKDFCSFTCLSNWALKQQELLAEYIDISKKHYKEASKDGKDD